MDLEEEEARRKEALKREKVKRKNISGVLQKNRPKKNHLKILYMFSYSLYPLNCNLIVKSFHGKIRKPKNWRNSGGERKKRRNVVESWRKKPRGIGRRRSIKRSWTP